MNKVPVWFILSLTFLLYGLIYAFAHSFKADVQFTCVELSEISNDNSFSVVQNFYRSGSSEGEKENKNLKSAVVQFEEEVKSVSIKNYASPSNLNSAISYTLALGCFNQNIKKRLHSSQHITFLATDNRFLLFQAFRI